MKSQDTALYCVLKSTKHFHSVAHAKEMSVQEASVKDIQVGSSLAVQGLGVHLLMQGVCLPAKKPKHKSQAIL